MEMIADCNIVESSIYIYRILCFWQYLPHADVALNEHCFPDMRVALHLVVCFLDGGIRTIIFGGSITLIALRCFAALILW